MAEQNVTTVQPTKLTPARARLWVFVSDLCPTHLVRGIGGFTLDLSKRSGSLVLTTGVYVEESGVSRALSALGPDGSKQNIFDCELRFLTADGRIFESWSFKAGISGPAALTDLSYETPGCSSAAAVVEVAVPLVFWDFAPAVPAAA